MEDWRKKRDLIKKFLIEGYCSKENPDYEKYDKFLEDIMSDYDLDEPIYNAIVKCGNTLEEEILDSWGMSIAEVEEEEYYLNVIKAQL